MDAENETLSTTPVQEAAEAAVTEIALQCPDCTFYIYLSAGISGIVILLIIIVNLIICCCCCKRRRRRKRKEGYQMPYREAGIPESHSNPKVNKKSLTERQNPSTTKPNPFVPRPSSTPAKSGKEMNGKNIMEEKTAVMPKTPAEAKTPQAATTTRVLTSCSTQPSLSLDITQPKTESEMSPDELEYFAFSVLDAGKRFRIFNTAVKMAERIAESHGFWINDRDPTVPGDEEAWLQKEADNLVRTCVEIHGVPVPDFGSNKQEYMEFIEKHSLREIYQIALYTEVEEITRLFFLNAVMDRFREVVRKLPADQLEKCQHPIPLLYRIWKSNPDIFDCKPKKHEKTKKRR